MEEILDDIRRDAITKSKVSKGEKRVLEEAAGLMIELSETVRLKGLSHLKEKVGSIGSEFLKLAASAVVDVYEPEYYHAFVAEIMSNAYWIDEPEGVQALVDYIYLRGLLCIWQGDTIQTMIEIFRSLMPMELRKEFGTRMMLRLDSKRSEERCKQICPSFQDTDTLENIHILEEMVRSLDGRSLQKVLMDSENIDELAVCVYAMDPKIRKKIIDNSRRHPYLIMERVERLHQIQFDQFDEKKVSKTVCAMIRHVEQLEKSSEIILRQTD